MDNGITMTYNMKRSMVFIKSDLSIPFHTEVDVDWIKKAQDSTGEFSDNCKVTSEVIGDKYLKVDFWLPELQDYITMTDCLYVKGTLKEVFKDAMRWAKPNRMAFAMSSWHLNKRNITGEYIKEWYTNKKTRSDSKFFEESRDTLVDRMVAFKGYMSLDDCVMNCALYDHDHNVKHSYFLFTKRDDETERQIDSVRLAANTNYQFKKQYNTEQGVEYMIRTTTTHNLDYHDFHDIPPGIFDSDFNKLNIPIL